MLPAKTQNLFKLSVISAVVLFSLSCSTVRRLAPLEKGESAVNASLGGPITEVGDVYLPLPLLAASYGYGFTDRLNGDLSLHLTSLLFGIMHIEGGVNWHPFLPDKFKPGLTVKPGIFFLTDFSNGGSRFYPDVSLTGYWEIQKWIRPYAGIENWFEFARERDDGAEQENHWLICPYAGAELTRGKWGVMLELKLYTPNLSNQGRPVRNIGIGDKGAWGIFLGVNRRFGGKDE